jgi:hypothetical protein
MITDDYLTTSSVVRRLNEGPFCEHIDLLVEELQLGRYSLVTSHRYLSLAGDFGFWLTGLDQETMPSR